MIFLSNFSICHTHGQKMKSTPFVNILWYMKFIKLFKWINDFINVIWNILVFYIIEISPSKSLIYREGLGRILHVLNVGTLFKKKIVTTIFIHCNVLLTKLGLRKILWMEEMQTLNHIGQDLQFFFQIKATIGPWMFDLLSGLRIN